MPSRRVDALLDAAEAEFAEAGIGTGSLRRIMRHAGTDPGAVHYHFGGRQALAEAVLQRLLAPLNARRLELLHTLSEPGDRRQPTPLPRIVDALIRPDIELAHDLQARSPGRARLLSEIYLRPAAFVETTVAAHFAPVADAFRPHLESALPALPFAAIAWRVRWYVFGVLGALLAHGTAPFERPADDLLSELTHSLAAALAAPQ